MHGNRPSRTRRAIAAVLLALTIFGGGVAGASAANAASALAGSNVFIG
jgi:hypothetical protein